MKLSYMTGKIWVIECPINRMLLLPLVKSLAQTVVIPLTTRRGTGKVIEPSRKPFSPTPPRFPSGTPKGPDSISYKTDKPSRVFPGGGRRPPIPRGEGNPAHHGEGRGFYTRGNGYTCPILASLPGTPQTHPPSKLFAFRQTDSSHFTTLPPNSSEPSFPPRLATTPIPCRVL